MKAFLHSKLNLFFQVVILGCLSNSVCIADYNDLFFIHKFDNVNSPGSLIEDSDGVLYGSSVSGGENDGGIIYRINQDGSGYQILHLFPAYGTDGQHPSEHILEANDGVLYGTTNTGGINGLGTLYKINKDGTAYSLLHEFSESDVGYYPQGALLEGSDSRLYGTTSNTRFGSAYGLGSIFSIKKDGSEFTKLIDFWDYPANSSPFGVRPRYGMLEGSEGYLYGTTDSAIIRTNKSGTELISLHKFSGGMNGFVPVGKIVIRNQVIYGVTRQGGASSVGMVYKLNADGSGFTVLWSFVGSSSAPHLPSSGVVHDGKTTLYGIADDVIYKINTDGYGFSKLTNKDEDKITGVFTEMMLSSDGDLYGVVNYGGHCLGGDNGPGIFVLKNSSESIFNWVERIFPEFFPNKEVTQEFPPWKIRYYSATGVYLGINTDDKSVYVVGGVFGNIPLYLGTESTIFNMTLGTLQNQCH